MGNLTSYTVIYDNGDVQNVSMAAGVTLEEARAHYVGQRFEITETTFRTGLAVHLYGEAIADLLDAMSKLLNCAELNMDDVEIETDLACEYARAIVAKVVGNA